MTAYYSAPTRGALASGLDLLKDLLHVGVNGQRDHDPRSSPLTNLYSSAPTCGTLARSLDLLQDLLHVGVQAKLHHGQVPGA